MIRIITTLISVLLLSACGSSGGAGGNDDTQNPVSDPVSDSDDETNSDDDLSVGPTALDSELTAILLDVGFDPSPLQRRLLPAPGEPVVELGKELFFSRSLSFADDVACASCHDPRLAGTDNLSLPVGVGAHDEMIVGPGRRHDGNFYIDPKADAGPNVPRNSPTTFNIAFYDKAMFWDGRVEVVELAENGSSYVPATTAPANGEGALIRTPDSYSNSPDKHAGPNLTAAQARFPVTSVTEMRGFSTAAGQTSEQIRSLIAEKLIDRGWEPYFREGYNDYVTATESLITDATIAFALGEYQRSQVALDNPFFAYLNGDLQAISQSAVAGAIRFFDKEQGGCVSCHAGPHFTNEQFYALATPQIGRGKNASRQDYGRYNVNRSANQRHAFRTPSLLNTELTHPYMHAGSLTTLEQAIEWHFDPQAQLDAYDYSLQQLPQFDGLGTNTSAYPVLSDGIKASYRKQSGSSDYLQDYQLVSADAQAISDYAAFLRTLTSGCLLDMSCVDQWMPDATQPSPDGMRLNPLLSVFDNSEVYAVYPPDETEQGNSVFPDLSSAPAYPSGVCSVPAVSAPDESGVVAGFEQIAAPDVDRRLGDGLFADQRLYSDSVLMSGAIAAADIDGDCDQDLVIDTGHPLGIRVFLNNDGQFTAADNNYGLTQQVDDLAAFSLADINGDGWPDLFAGHLFTDDARLWLNNGEGEFIAVADFGFLSVRMTHNAAFADLDADGDLDLFTANWSIVKSFEEPHLWLNDGRGYLTETGPTGISGSFGERDYTLTPNVADMNNDGHPDILSAADFLTVQVYQGQGDGQFETVTDINVITDENAMGAALGDYDNDGDLDWFVGNVYDAEVMSGLETETEGNWGPTGNRLYRNDSATGGDITFADVTDEAEVRDGAWAWGVCFKDFDNDGWLDLFQVNGYGYKDGTFDSPLFELLTDMGMATMRGIRDRMYSSAEDMLDDMYSQYGDFDDINERLDGEYGSQEEFEAAVNNLYEGAELIAQSDDLLSEFHNTPARLFMNNQDGTFREQATLRGIADRNEGRGLVCNDFDRDGDIDIVILNHTGAPTYYENHFRQSGKDDDHFINLRLHGLEGNRYAYGAKVTVISDGLNQYREMRFENNYNSNNAPELHFGLGSDTLITSLRIEWPDGQVSTLNNVSADQFLVIDHPSN